MLAMDLYSTSAEDLDITCCFLDFQDTREEAKKIQNPVSDLLVSGQVP